MFDGTTIVQKALSAIVRTEEKIGFTLMVDILRGTLSPDVVSNKYNEIKTFGAGRDISARDWHDYLLQMLQMGFFEIAYNEDRHLHITQLGQEVLYGRRNVQLAIINREEFTVKSRRKKQREEREMEWVTVGQGQSGLFSRLREVRRQVAAEIGKPAFIVMSDKSLQDLVLKRPTTLEAMADVYGFGEYKAKAYGKPFIEAIKQYASDNVDLPFPDVVEFADVPSILISPEPASYMEQQKQLHASAYAHWDDEEDKKLTEYYRQGLSASEIASLMNRNTGGISSRIKKLGLRDDESASVDVDSSEKKSDGYKQELERLIEMQADINRQIEELRKKMK
jgi:ATP-dependent DNA helicase RecQ